MKRILLLAVGLLVTIWASAQLINVDFEEYYVHPDEDVTDAGIDGGAPVNYNGFVTYRLYAYVEGPEDLVVSVTGNVDNIFSIGLTGDGQLFQHPANPNNAYGPLNGTFLNPLLGFNMYQYDSYLTIGFGEDADAVDGENWSPPTGLVSGEDTWESDFINGDNFVISSFFGGGYFILPSNDAGVAITDEDGNHKVLLGQFTFDTSDNNSIEFIGCVEVFPGGLAGDGPDHGLVANAPGGDPIVIGCTDEAALNFDILANLDDGSCVYPCTLELLADSLQTTNVLCFGDINGAVSFDTAGTIGAQGGVSYSLDNEDFSSNPNYDDLEAGDYILYAVDGEGCTAEIPFTINSGTEIEIALEEGTLVTPSCNGLSDASFCVTIEGGVGPYTVALTEEGLMEGSTDQCFDNLSFGTYAIWVQDANGCIETFSPIFISQPNPVIIQVSVENDATCSYSSDGCILALGSGGTPTFTYEIEGVVESQTDNSLCGLAPGEYIVTATEANGCSASSDLVTISSPVAVEAIAGDITDLTCWDSTDGEICIAASGGNGTYTFSQDSLAFSTIECFSDLAEGEYTFYAQSGECVDAIILSIEAPDQISFDEVIQTNVDEDCDGELEVVNIGGGTGDITIEWEDEDGNTFNTETISDLCVGDVYSLTLTDENGCEVTSEEEFEIIVGLFELSNNIAINMFPNPTNGIVNLNIEGLSGQRVSAVIVNALGEQVSAEEFGVLNGYWNNELSLEGEADGIYFINLTVGEETITQRVIKQ
ncbi:MAG: T9SS type A sorting domain-containing protein [Flavobacteriales bacterium]